MDTTLADTLIGTLVGGRYRIRNRVARGGMSTVYTATDERLERTVALKIIHPAQAGDGRFVERFTDEAKAIARLTHPHVVAVYDQGNHQGQPYLIMEYVRGRTLREVLAEQHRLPVPDALAIFEQMLSAVAAAHRAGLVHRDIKPDNVLVAEAPAGDSLVDAVVKVADFGLARAVEEATSADSGGQLLATAAYVAPELVTDGYADPRSDVYSAGIVLFEMLTGRVPYDGRKPVEVAWQHVDQDVPPPSKYVTGLPSPVDELVVTCTRRDPSNRPTDAGSLLAQVVALREELGAVLAASRVAAQPTVPVPPVDPATRVLTQIPHMSRDRRPPWARLPDRAPSRSSFSQRPAALNWLSSWYAQVTATTRGRRGLAAAIITLGLLLAVGGWWYGLGRYTSAPTLTGLTEAQAVAQARQAGFTIRLGQARFDPKIAEGSVVDQRPRAMSQVVRGGTIVLYLSRGPERYQLPDETGKAFDDASKDLAELHLVIKEVDAYDDNMPAGHVLSMSPEAGQTVTPGTLVTLTVSKGRAPLTVPNVVGQNVTDATNLLQSMGLVVAVTQQQSNLPAGQVLSQNPADGAGATNGQTVILTVSTGPAQVTVPDVTGQTVDQATATLQQAGLTVNVPFAGGPGATIQHQNPAANTQVPPGTQVTIWIF